MINQPARRPILPVDLQPAGRGKGQPVWIRGALLLLVLLSLGGCSRPAGLDREITPATAGRARPISIQPEPPEPAPREPVSIAAAETTIAAASLRATLLRHQEWKSVRISPSSENQEEQAEIQVAIARKPADDGRLKLALRLTAADATVTFSQSYVYPYTVSDPGPFERFSLAAAEALVRFHDSLESTPPATRPTVSAAPGEQASSRTGEFEALLLDTISRFAAIFDQDFRTPLLDWRRTGTPALEQLLELEHRLRSREIIGTAAVVRALIVAARPVQPERIRPPSLAALIEYGRQPSQPAGSGIPSNQPPESSNGSGLRRQTPLLLEIDRQLIEYRGTPEELYRSWHHLVRQL